MASFRGRRLLMIGIFCMVTGLVSAAEKLPDVDEFYASLRSLPGPVTIRDAEMFRDGGTVRIVIAGPSGEDLVMCMDCAIFSKTRGAYYINEGHPGAEGAVLVPKDHRLDKFISRVLQEWSDSVVKDEKTMAHKKFVMFFLDRCGPVE